MQTAAPAVRDIVLVGAGHSHVQVLRRFGMRPEPGVRLTVIAREVHTPYSGMLPGHVAGRYDRDEMHIDVARLARFADARLIPSEVTGLDLDSQRVVMRDRPPLRYDVLSLNTGGVPGAGYAEQDCDARQAHRSLPAAVERRLRGTGATPDAARVRRRRSRQRGTRARRARALP